MTSSRNCFYSSSPISRLLQLVALFGISCLSLQSAGGIAVLSAAELPSLQQVPVFVSRSGPYNLYRIPGLIVTPAGSVLAYAEGRRHGGDWDGIDLVMKRSTDGGISWGEETIVGRIAGPIERNPVSPERHRQSTAADDVTYNNPVAIADHQTGEVHFIYCVEYMRCFWMVSRDDGVTFSPPVEITDAFESFRPAYDWKVLATGPAHGIALRSGRLVIPVWLSTSTGANAHHPSVTSTIFSDDHGQSWQAGEIAVANTETFRDPNETCLAELADGRVMLNVRNESSQRRRLKVVSPNGAAGWSTPEFVADLPEPVCMASLVRFSQGPNPGDNKLLFANPDSPRLRREQLTIKLSEDDGQTWPIARIVEQGSSGYSDLAVTRDGTILCLYERRFSSEANPSAPPEIVLARMNLESITQQPSTSTQPIPAGTR